jgi:murein DD-endopeptidase MepM/ murein hydrolase activator NlpD
MLKIKIDKLVKNNFTFVLLIFLVIVSILATSFYTLNIEKQKNNFSNFFENTYLKKTISLIINNLNPKLTQKIFIVQKGDSFKKILNTINLPDSEIKIINKNLSKYKFINKLHKGQKIKFKLDNTKPIKVLEILFEKSKLKHVVFLRSKEDSNIFEYKEGEKNLKKIFVYKESQIKNSLYGSATDISVPPNIIIDFARIYGFQVDFQRDIWKNDSFQIVYESFMDSKDQILDTGNILYANLILQGKDNSLFIFKTKDGVEHFDEYGKSVRKSLMKTPINGARLSSSFGMRKHPILGFNKMHRGTDFAAPMGTPIMASGDGKIIRARWCGGGGNCIKIKHNSTYTTVYAHMSKFARGIKEGVRVRQGQIIGYVGSTGLSTGAHLHYEVIINGKKINSQKLKLPSGKILKNKERKLFELSKIKLKVLKSELINSQ